MNEKELIELFLNAEDGETILLPPNKTIDVWTDTCFSVKGYHFSNTASYEQNPEGHRPVAIYLKDKKDIVIDGNGSIIMIHGISTPFLFDNCKNITVKNLVFDYARPTMSEFDIVSQDEDGKYTIEIQPEFLFDIMDNELIWHGEIGSNGEYLWTNHYRDPMNIAMFKDPKTEWVQMLDRDKALQFPSIPKFKAVNQLSPTRLLVELEDKNAFFPIGCRIQTRNTMREQIGGCFERCQNVHFKDCTVFAMHGFGILAQFCENIYYDNITIVPKQGRTIASNADFFQASGCKGDCVITNCTLSDGHDDFINIHGTYLKVIDISNEEITVKFMNPYSRGFTAFTVGDEVDFVCSTTLIPYCTHRIFECTKINDDTVRLILDRKAEGRIGDYIENVTWTPEVIIKNNRFGPSMGRGVLCTTRKKTVIADNLFYKTAGNVLCVEDDCNFWFESGGTGETEFVGNTIIGCGYGFNRGINEPVISYNPQVMDEKAVVYPHKALIVQNNTFSSMQADSYRFYLRYLQTCIYKNNISDKEISFDTHCVEKIMKE